MIESRQNEKFKKYLNLNTRKNIERAQEYLVFGKNVVNDLLQSNQNFISLRSIEHESISENEITFSPGLFRELDIFGTQFPILVQKLPVIKTWNPNSEPEENTLLLPCSKPSNMGAILRSASAFGIRKIVLLQEACFPFLPKATRSASGALSHLQFYSGPSIQKLVSTSALYILDMHGLDLNQFTPPKTANYLVGDEANGIPKQLCGERLTIPILSDNIESLNVAAAAAILLSRIHTTKA